MSTWASLCIHHEGCDEPTTWNQQSNCPISLVDRANYEGDASIGRKLYLGFTPSLQNQEEANWWLLTVQGKAQFETLSTGSRLSWIAKGYSKTDNIDNKETFSLMEKMIIVRMVFSLIIVKGLHFIKCTWRTCSSKPSLKRKFTLCNHSASNKANIHT